MDRLAFLPGMDPPLGNGEVRVAVGEFFERTAGALLGGEPHVRFWNVDVDLVHWSDPTLLIEIKAFNFRNGFLIGQDQLTSYEGLVGNNFPFTNAQVFYLVFGYKLDRGERLVGKTFREINRRLWEADVRIWMIPLIELLTFKDCYRLGIGDMNKWFSQREWKWKGV